MSLLSQIAAPADVQALTPDELEPLATEIRDFLIDNVSRTGGHLGPNLGVVELTIALHRVFDQPARRPAVGHRSPDVRPQAAHRPAGLRQPATARRPLRLPGPRGVRTTSSRTRTPPRRCPTPMAWPRPSSCAVSPSRDGRRRHRRRCTHRRHGMGGAEQHRRRRGPSGGHRRQRQRALVCADDRRPRPPPGHAPHHPWLRAVPRLGSARCSSALRSSASRSTRPCTA